ncbi:MAG TPA: cupin domain-containing protein [Verrucomicrobiae bacterium]|jgi:quercetin dioxygenase-like cupin family protein|nr:cupin domain-containing protein [Verrucomicrobiae bacterium]
MMTNKALIVALAVGAAITFSTAGRTPAQESVTRTVLLKKPLEADPKKEVTVFMAEFKPGARTGKHYHPGQEFIYVVDGEGRIEEAGKPPVDLKPGMAIYFESDPAKPTYVHEGINTSKTKPLKLVTTLITEKGQPLAIPVK